MAADWGMRVTLPHGGVRFDIDVPRAIAEPMGGRGARVKWPAETRREVRVGVEDVLLDGIVGQMIGVSAKFEGRLVTQGEIGDGDGGVYVIREVDPRRHVVVATRDLRERQVAMVSMEASAHDAVEVGDEWGMLEQLHGSLTAIEPTPDGATLQVTPFSREDGLGFDLPPDVSICQWAYGMAHLREKGRGDLGRMFYGALAAADQNACLAALEQLGEDDALRDVSVDVDGPDAVIDAWLTDRRGLTANLIAGCRPIGEGVALVAATLLLDGDDRERIFEVLTHAVETAGVFGSGPPRAPSDAAEVLAPIDSFRHRV
jgi:hypothetical protein